MAWYNPFRRTPLAEAAAPSTPANPAVAPTGFAYGIPPGGTTEYNQGGGALDGDRRSMLEELYQAYLTCPWASACVDVIARTITAGGLEVAWDGDAEDVPEAPPQVEALRALFDYVNPSEDIRQLMRGVITDLLVFGDAYVELVWVADRVAGMWSLDAPSMNVIADEHGQVSGYVQLTENGKRAEFTPEQVIHVSLDSPRSGVNGISPTQKNLLPITVWLFTAATLKEVMRKGDPATLHVDFPTEVQDGDVRRWRSQYQVQNLGARNIGTPVTTRGGAAVKELKAYAVQHYLATLDQKRDEILSGFGVPPAKVGVIETGNLGAGTGTTQDRTFNVNTCGPVAATVSEKFQFRLGAAFQLPDGWVVRFVKVDWRDDKTIDDIASTRLRDGRWTLNRSRAEIGEPPVDGGDDPVLVDRQNLVLWSDMAKASQALIDSKEGGSRAPSPLAGIAAPTESVRLPVRWSDLAKVSADESGSPRPVPGAPESATAATRADARRAWQESYVRELARLRGNADA